MLIWVRRNLKWVAPTAVVVCGFGIWLIFGYFGFHTLLFDKEVDEDVPVFASGAGATEAPADATTGDPVEDGTDTATDDAVDDGTDAAAEGPVEGAVPESADGEIVVVYSGSFIDRSHPTEGTAEVLNDGTSQRFLRFEDFSTDNGPDLNVYLSTALPDAADDLFDDDFIDLGNLKGNVGPQNYEIPEDVDLDRYPTVVIWCVRFTVAFGAASLGSA
jgi:hypothetical protein